MTGFRGAALISVSQDDCPEHGCRLKGEHEEGGKRSAAAGGSCVVIGLRSLLSTVPLL